MYTSKFEQLPDEILLEICIYLKPFDVIYSFGQLNTRLEQTITQYRRDADLHHLTLKQFHYWFNYLLSYTCQSIQNLVLSNWNSPGQISLFNQLTKTYLALYHLFPNIKQVRLIDITNDDVEILSKLQMIEKIFIDADALIPLDYSTHVLFDQYLFCSSNQFKEIRLWGIQGGLRLQHQMKIIENFSLQRLTISLALFDDLILICQRSPNLTNFNVEIVQDTINDVQQISMENILPRHLKFFHFQTTDQHVLSYEDFSKLIQNLPTIEILSLDMDTDDIDYANGDYWKNLLTNLPCIKHIYFKIRIWFSSDMLSIDINAILHSFLQANIPICCYTDIKLLHLDTIPYNMSEFDTSMSVTVSPRVKLAQTAHIELLQHRAKSVQTLIIDGQHALTSIEDYLSVIERFSRIEILQINSINIEDDEDNDIEIYNNRNFRLSNLGYLHYIRSTNCKIHIPFFMYLTNNYLVSPQLKALSMMYGDLIYLCKRLSGFHFERIKELWLYAGNADGHIILKDMDLLIRTFPCLEHFLFNNQSSRLINRHIKQITEMILSSLSNLISFRISCNKGSLKLASLMDEEECYLWIKRICKLDDHQLIQVTLNKRILAVWK